MSTRTNRRSEKWLERALVDFVTGQGGAAIKLTDPTKNGLLDRLILWPGGIAEFVELKSTGKTPRPLQRAVHSEITALGFKCTVIDNEEKLIQWQNSTHGRTRLK